MTTSFIEYITEARSNPDKNIKVSAYRVFKERYESSGELAGTGHTNLFLSFQNRLKLGVNPKTKYPDTPSGVFAYSSDYVNKEVDEKDENFDVLPYKGNAQHIYLFSLQGNFVNLKTVSSGEVSQYIDKLKDNMIAWGKSKRKRKNWMDTTKIPKEVEYTNEENSINKRLEIAKRKGNGRSLWKIVNICTAMMTPKKKEMSVFLWNKVFRDLGIDGCIDPGVGIIHHIEPSQTVIFNINSIANVQTIMNKWSNQSRKEGKERRLNSRRPRS